MHLAPLNRWTFLVLNCIMSTNEAEGQRLMEIMLWLVIIILFVLSLIGIVLPILPSVALVWAGVAVFHFFLDAEALTWLTWGTMIFITLVILAADQLSNVLVVKRFGGGKFTTIASVIGSLVGIFVLPPWGIVLMPFVFVFALEILQKRTPAQALRTALGTIVAFLSSMVAKGGLQLVMIIVFLMDVFV